MRVAIPLFDDEVSPRFGVSGRFLVATIDDRHVQAQAVEDVSHICPQDFPEFLSSLGVAKVICGGVHRRFRDELERRGIEVIWGVIGSAAEALSAYLGGRLQCDQFVCGESSGRHQCGHGRRHGHEPSPVRGGRRRGESRHTDHGRNRARSAVLTPPSRPTNGNGTRS
jgi:predicted Fe-Mo cluster-binding NifX family protein